MGSLTSTMASTDCSVRTQPSSCLLFQIEGRIIGVTARARTIERIGNRLVERRIQSEATRKVRIGDKNSAISDGVGFTLGQYLFAGFFGKRIISYYRTAKRFLQFRFEARLL